MQRIANTYFEMLSDFNDVIQAWPKADKAKKVHMVQKHFKTYMKMGFVQPFLNFFVEVLSKKDVKKDIKEEIIKILTDIVKIQNTLQEIEFLYYTVKVDFEIKSLKEQIKHDYRVYKFYKNLSIDQ